LEFFVIQINVNPPTQIITSMITLVALGELKRLKSEEVKLNFDEMTFD